MTLSAHSAPGSPLSMLAVSVASLLKHPFLRGQILVPSLRPDASCLVCVSAVTASSVCGASNCLIVSVCWIFCRSLGKLMQWDYFLHLTDKGDRGACKGVKSLSESGPAKTRTRASGGSSAGIFLQYLRGSLFMLHLSSFRKLKSNS